MFKAPVEPASAMSFRRAAEDRLKERRAPASVGWPLSLDTLALLHRLATDPERATEALKLLHELQVHQVELDLLNAEIERNQASLAEEFARFKGAYEVAPFGSVIVDLEGVILEVNLEGARLLGTDRDEAVGRTLASYLAERSRPDIEVLLKSLRDGEKTATGELTRSVGGGRSLRFRIEARALPDRQSVLVVAYV